MQPLELIQVGTDGGDKASGFCTDQQTQRTCLQGSLKWAVYQADEGTGLEMYRR